MDWFSFVASDSECAVEIAYSFFFSISPIYTIFSLCLSFTHLHSRTVKDNRANHFASSAAALQPKQKLDLIIAGKKSTATLQLPLDKE